MAVLLRKRKHPRPEMAIAPMIDCVFLMLIYFMVSSTLQPQEADIAFQLPGVVEQSEPLDMPDEQVIEIRADGRAVLNGSEYGNDDATAPWGQLTAVLARFRQASEANRVEAIITLQPDPEATHQAIIRVMDACAAAKISAVNFALGED